VPPPNQMLTRIQVKDLKSFSDSGPIPLSRINILIGANNAGKSTFLSAIELFFRSMRAGGFDGPLAFETMATFASFDSSLRRHWNRNTQRPSKIGLSYEWVQSQGREKSMRSYDFACANQGTDDSIVVAEADYRFDDAKTRVHAVRTVDGSTGRVHYDLTTGKKKLMQTDEQWFHQLMPIDVMRLMRREASFFFRGPSPDLEVVNPYRPVPRSFYVLDDPNLAAEDRSFLTYLIRLWASKDGEEKKIRERIATSLSKVGLTQYFDVAQVSKKIGPKVIEIRVAPTSSRQKVTIADAGFGLSQFLPLAVYDARLSSGTLIAYQPEVHLHPFAQSRLADIFVDSASRGNQLFVETHSIDLILRLQTKIARSEVDPRDVSVLCFENNNGKSEVSVMSFTETGAPSKSWPTGFLDTSLGLARELTSARISRLQAAEK
jgi:AAA ATPase domain